MEELEKMKQLKELIEKWQKEIIKDLDKGYEIRIRKNKDTYVLFQDIIKKIK